MLSTIVLAGVYIGLSFVMAVLWGLFLRLGLRLVKTTDVTTRGVVGATALIIVLQIGINVLSVVALTRFDVPFSDLDFINIAAQVVLSCAIINTAFKTGYRKAFLAWLPTLCASILLIAMNVLVVQPYVVESFFMPTNSMAPTLVGNHWRSVCPECGQRGYSSPRNPRRGSFEFPLMICENFHVTRQGNVDRRVLSGDRFLVSKFLEPRRWDVVAFRYPGQPSTLYAMRLVGLPGETIRIHDGSVWADGERLTPPESLRGIEYLSELPNFPMELWGSPENPATLAENEYFVLGDFSARSFDSRTWIRGAPGYHPYAVPEAYIVGVVTHTFWPPRRWRIHR